MAIITALRFGIAGMLGGALMAPSSPLQAQAFSVPAELQAKIDSHPHVRRVTDWGSRPEWSADSRRLLFVSREYGDVFELDVATGKTRPLTFHFSHDGIFRANYLPSGDILLTAPRDHTPGKDTQGRFFGSEIWLLKSDLSGPPVPLNERNMEGIAVARDSMKIAWATPYALKTQTSGPPSEGKQSNANEMTGNQIWMADVVTTDGAALANKRLVLDCGSGIGVLGKWLAREGRRCTFIEPQNFVPNTQALTFTMISSKLRANAPGEVSAYVLDLRTNEIRDLSPSPSFAEAEGVFPDGKFTLVEHTSDNNTETATHVLDLWKFPLDGSENPKRVTRYNALDRELKSNQGVVSPDGRWMAFSVSTSAIEAKIPGQGIGIFLMDLKAAGIQ